MSEEKEKDTEHPGRWPVRRASEGFRIFPNLDYEIPGQMILDAAEYMDHLERDIASSGQTILTLSERCKQLEKERDEALEQLGKEQTSYCEVLNKKQQEIADLKAQERGGS